MFPTGRLPWGAYAACRGLTVGLCDAVQTQETLWFGWSGHQHADAADRPVQSEQVGNVNYVTFDLTQRQYDRFYLNFSNGVLWPLCHYRTNLIRYTREDCDAYYEANEVFADRLVGLLEPDDTVWIHDYHLFPLGKMLRDRGLRGGSGSFCIFRSRPGAWRVCCPGSTCC